MPRVSQDYNQGASYSVPVGGLSIAEFEFDEAGDSDPVYLSGRFCIQVTGDATAFVAGVERSTRDPAGGSPNWAPADVEGISGDLTDGLTPVLYDEPGAAWWRVSVDTLTGGAALVVFSGSEVKPEIDPA